MDLFTQATELGIQTEFYDGQGHRRVTDAAALQVILDAMPVQLRRRWLQGPVVIRRGEAARTELCEAVALPLRWTIGSSDGIIAQGESGDRTLHWPADLPIGCYRLHLTDATQSHDEAPLIVAPPTAYSGSFDRCWILAVQLYGVRSARNWGMGDFTDLERLIDLAASLGAGGVGLNPLHALFDDRPSDCSPYSPNSRQFLNALYIDVEQLPEFSRERFADVEDTLAELARAETISYATVAGLKWRALRQAYDSFCADPRPDRAAGFAAFREERGALLLRFACFEVLRHKFHTPWWDWPAEWRQPDDAQCEKLRDGEDGGEIGFIEFVQWCADEQLRGCRDSAKRRGMSIGLYLDVAVGVQSDGFDAWNERVAISRQLGVGAPPDPLNTAGQDWGLAGFNAAGLEARSFEPYRAMLRASMRYAGAIRLDHVLGLKRLYLVPHGFRADNGAYVQMPFEALLAITALESCAHHCVVIGEDLGTVPDGFRDRLAAWGIWSYRVMIFERDGNGAFRGPDAYPANALVTFNTHDLATFAGWRSFADLQFKRSIGIDPGESDDARWHALGMLGDMLRHQAIERDDFYAVTKFLTRTHSRLLAISLEDLLKVTDQPNIPGTVDQHPNWRRRLPVPLEDIVAAIDQPALQDATAGRGQQR
ncbi:MAG TPA: 4-alpha-glucanotransferase [Rhodopseudomonas sp.]|uniref:4-alpha-glucanotransferase n=1 Tax=Rhodopseudomonas sp. TaxID=1078 RepID=UPI002EDAF626